MQYRTVRSKETEALDEKVNKLLAEGWELHGPPYSCEGWMCQALRKEEGTKKPFEFVPEAIVPK